MRNEPYGEMSTNMLEDGKTKINANLASCTVSQRIMLFSTINLCYINASNTEMDISNTSCFTEKLTSTTNVN